MCPSGSLAENGQYILSVPDHVTKVYWLGNPLVHLEFSQRKYLWCAQVAHSQCTFSVLSGVITVFPVSKIQNEPEWCSASVLWELCRHTPLFPLFCPIYARPPVLGMMLNCIIMPHDYYDNTWHVLMIKIPCIGYNSWTWSINFKALCCQLTTIGDSGYRQHGMSTPSQRTSSTTNTLLP